MNGNASVAYNNTIGGSGGGGGVYVDGGTFTMNDSAKIEGNTVAGNSDSNNRYMRGGVYVGESGTFEMNGNASVTGNTASNGDGDGGGVHLYGGTFTVSGNVKITDNKKGSSDVNNVYRIITVDGSGLTQDARIGITTANTPRDNYSIEIATGAAGNLNYNQIFTPDVANKGYVVTKDDNRNLSLGTHRHSWTYAQGNTTDTIIATCVATGCTITDSVRVIINKPLHTTYGDGYGAEAMVGQSYGYNITVPPITYKKGDTTMICTFEVAMGLHPLWLYLFQKIGARNIGEIETVSHAIQFVQLDQHQVDIGLHIGSGTGRIPPSIRNAKQERNIPSYLWMQVTPGPSWNRCAKAFPPDLRSRKSRRTIF